MLEMALHVLDIAENSTRAGASLVEITIREDLKHNIFSIEIKDNGAGMDKETLEKTMDPFYTTKKVRRIGLGLPMLAQAARTTGGSFSIESDIGRGTRVYAQFKHNHIDRQPLGDIAGVIIALILGNPEVDFVYIHKRNAQTYSLDTREIRQGIGDIPLNHREILNLIRENVKEGLAELNE